MKLKKLVIVSLLLATSTKAETEKEFKDYLTEYYRSCQQKADFYSDKQRGWFYKEYCQQLEEKIKKTEKNVEEKKNEVAKKKQPVEIIKENLDNPKFWKENKEVYRWLKDDKILSEIDKKTLRKVKDKVKK